MHKCLVVKVKQWMIPKCFCTWSKKPFSKILKSLHAPLFRICLGQIIGKQSSDALNCNFIQISLSGWWISKFKHLKSPRLLLPETTLASLCVVISLKSTLFRASCSLGFGLWTAFGFCLTFGLGFGLTFSFGKSLTFGLGFGFGNTWFSTFGQTDQRIWRFSFQFLCTRKDGNQKTRVPRLHVSFFYNTRFTWDASDHATSSSIKPRLSKLLYLGR